MASFVHQEKGPVHAAAVSGVASGWSAWALTPATTSAKRLGTGSEGALVLSVSRRIGPAAIEYLQANVPEVGHARLISMPRAHAVAIDDGPSAQRKLDLPGLPFPHQPHRLPVASRGIDLDLGLVAFDEAARAMERSDSLR